jgi:hypothetical protein
MDVFHPRLTYVPEKLPPILLRVHCVILIMFTVVKQRVRYSYPSEVRHATPCKRLKYTKASLHDPPALAVA